METATTKPKQNPFKLFTSEIVFDASCQNGRRKQHDGVVPLAMPRSKSTSDNCSSSSSSSSSASSSSSELSVSSVGAVFRFEFGTATKNGYSSDEETENVRGRGLDGFVARTAKSHCSTDDDSDADNELETSSLETVDTISVEVLDLEGLASIDDPTQKSAAISENQERAGGETAVSNSSSSSRRWPLAMEAWTTSMRSRTSSPSSSVDKGQEGPRPLLIVSSGSASTSSGSSRNKDDEPKKFTDHGGDEDMIKPASSSEWQDRATATLSAVSTTLNETMAASGVVLQEYATKGGSLWRDFLSVGEAYQALAEGRYYSEDPQAAAEAAAAAAAAIRPPPPPVAARPPITPKTPTTAFV